MGNTLDRFWGVCGKFLSFYKTHDDGRWIVGQKRLQKAAGFVYIFFNFSLAQCMYIFHGKVKKMRSSTLNVEKKL